MRLRRCCENLDWLCQFYMDFMRYWVDWFCTMKWDVRCCGVIRVMWRCCWLLLGGVEMLWVFVELLWGDYVENFEKWWLTDWLPTGCLSWLYSSSHSFRTFKSHKSFTAETKNFSASQNLYMSEIMIMTNLVELNNLNSTYSVASLLHNLWINQNCLIYRM